MKFLILLLFTISSAQADSESSKIDIFDELQNIEDTKKMSLIDNQDSKNKVQQKKLELFQVKVTLEEVMNSKLKQIFIPRQTELIKISNNEVFYTTKDITPKAYVTVDNKNYRYIVDKNKIIKYKVHVTAITDIKEVTNLYEPPKYFQKVKKKIKKKKFDKRLPLYLGAKIQSALTSTDFTSTFIKNTNKLAPALRAEISLLTNISIPIDTGISLQYETIRGSNFTTQTLSLGPDFKFKELLGKYHLHLQARLSLFSNLTDTSLDIAQELPLSETALLIGLERDYKYFTIGYNLQRKWIRGNPRDSDINFNLSGETDNSFGIYISKGMSL